MGKIIPIILLIIVLGVGFVAYTFYTEKENLTTENLTLKEEKKSLLDRNSKLEYNLRQVSQENQNLQNKLKIVQEDLNRIEAERDEFKQKWADAAEKVDQLQESMQQARQPEVSVQGTTTITSTDQISEDHWADFVKKKASLEAKLQNLNDTIMDYENQLANLDKENKELSLKIDQLVKEKERLADEIKFKERTLRVMSMDLVSEREERAGAVKEVKKLRNENVSLKRELVLASKEKMNLQNNLKAVKDRKEALENRITDAENVLREKTMAFRDLQQQLEKAIVGGKKIMASESASVELPPIVVKPQTPGLKGLRGEVIAVNNDEQFIVVDLGESSGIRPGMLLKAMRQGREIATVEVIETRREISAADVKEVVGGFTIQEGDIVISR